MSMAQRLKALRNARQMSLRDVEKASGVSFTTVRRLEEDSGIDPKLKTLQALAKAYRTTVGYLLGEV